ncbi:MAG: YHYH protein, partial [Bacteroidota bacterium]
SEYATTHLTNNAIDWVNQQNQPWFLWLAHVAPHSPFHTPPDSMYTRDVINSDLHRYMAMVEALDFDINRLLENIPPNVLENTIIIYMGDNGTPNSILQGFPNRHGKGSVYQGGVNVPMFISGKGVSRIGEQENALVQSVDLYATILELAGVELAGGLHNSLSIKPLLTGQNFSSRPYAYTENAEEWAIRNDRYKLINFNTGTQEFYDLQEDPLENENLISTLSLEQSNILNELEAEANVIRNGWSCQDNILNGNESEVDVCESANCANDNSTSDTNIGCCASPEIPSVYEEEIVNGVRQINTNNFPPHEYCFNADNPDKIPQPINYEFEVPAIPSIAGSPTSILNNNNRPNQYYGVALSGVLMAPAPALPFIFENPNTGELNWDWVFEPTNNQGEGRDKVGLDCASAHTGGQGYHYHGNMFAYAETLFPGISTTTTPPLSPLQVGWASDGYPILYRFGPDVNGDLKLLQPGYQLRSGDRPGDGITAPCGPYNGKYTNDYEYIPGLGDLDECNGVARDITLITPSGSEQFDYFYVVTDSFPQIGRCLVGTPDISFDNSNRGTAVSLLPTSENEFNLSLIPNPVEDQLTISFTPSSDIIYRIELMDMQGRILLREKALIQQTNKPWETYLSLSEYPAGTYLIKVSSGNRSQT